MSASVFRLIKKYFAVNPELSESSFKVGEFRLPPGSFPQKYEQAPGPAEKLAKNYYYDRDHRRNYPQTVVYTQSDVAKLLIGSPKDPQLADPNSANAQATSSPASIPSLQEALASLDLAKTKDYEAFLPPLPRTRYQYKISEENYTIEAGKYWPVYLVK